MNKITNPINVTRQHAQKIYDLGVKLGILNRMREETIREFKRLLKKSTSTNPPSKPLKK